MFSIPPARHGENAGLDVAELGRLAAFSDIRFPARVSAPPGVARCTVRWQAMQRRSRPVKANNTE